MSITRLLYFSENQIDPAQGSMLSQLGTILSASNRNNKARGLTGALVFDDLWFLQALEGDRTIVWRAFEAIGRDERHTNVQLVEMSAAPERLFGNWWMGFAGKSAASASAFSPYLVNGKLQPHSMSAGEILSLMVALAGLGLARTLKCAEAA